MDSNVPRPCQKILCLPAKEIRRRELENRSRRNSRKRFIAVSLITVRCISDGGRGKGGTMLRMWQFSTTCSTSWGSAVDLLTNCGQLTHINCLNTLIKHLSMNVPRFIYTTDLIRISRKAGIFEAQTTDEVSRWVGLWGSAWYYWAEYGTEMIMYFTKRIWSVNLFNLRASVKSFFGLSRI
jgi:hypothetical protein